MRKLILIGLLLLASSAYAQTTTFILVRHAEKGTDDPKDPDLSDAGRARVESLTKLLSKTKIDAIYSTNFKRTKNTVASIAKEKGLTVKSYNPSKMDDVDVMLSKHKGGTLLISGHSNTTPAMINYLTGHADEYKTFDDSDYGNLIIVTVSERGKEGKVVWLTY